MIQCSYFWNIYGAYTYYQCELAIGSEYLATLGNWLIGLKHSVEYGHMISGFGIKDLCISINQMSVDMMRI